MRCDSIGRSQAGEENEEASDVKLMKQHLSGTIVKSVTLAASGLEKLVMSKLIPSEVVNALCSAPADFPMPGVRSLRSHTSSSATYRTR